jgi:hypothetical protein
MRWVIRFTPLPLYPRERAPGIHWIGCWVGHYYQWDTINMEFISNCRLREQMFFIRLVSVFMWALYWHHRVCFVLLIMDWNVMSNYRRKTTWSSFRGLLTHPILKCKLKNIYVYNSCSFPWSPVLMCTLLLQWCINMSHPSLYAVILYESSF